MTWENESLECTLTDNVCEGAVTENGNPKAGKVKITMHGDEIEGEGSDLEGAFTFIGKRPPAPPPGGSRTHKFEPAAFYNYFAWNIAPALHIFRATQSRPKVSTPEAPTRTASAAPPAAIR